MLHEGTAAEVYEAAKDYLAMYELWEQADTDLTKAYLADALDIALDQLCRIARAVEKGDERVP